MEKDENIEIFLKLRKNEWNFLFDVLYNLKYPIECFENKSVSNFWLIIQSLKQQFNERPIKQITEMPFDPEINKQMMEDLSNVLIFSYEIHHQDKIVKINKVSREYSMFIKYKLTFREWLELLNKVKIDIDYLIGKTEYNITLVNENETKIKPPKPIKTEIPKHKQCPKCKSENIVEYDSDQGLYPSDHHIECKDCGWSEIH